MIERAFALLKGKWRRLKYLYMLLLHRIPDVIITACCLHNFILLFNGGEGIEEDSDDEGQDAEPMEDDDDEDNRIAGILKRHALAQMLFNGD